MSNNMNISESLGEYIDCLRQGKPELLDHDTARAIAEHLDMLDNKIFDILQENIALKERIVLAEAGQVVDSSLRDIDLTNLPQKIRLNQAAMDHVAFDDTFLEAGMKASIINVHRKIDYDESSEGSDHCYGVTFNCEPFYEHNLSLMPRVYYPTIHTPKNTGEELFTAVEAGYYKHQETLYFYISCNAESPLDELKNQLKELMTGI